MELEIELASKAIALMSAEVDSPGPDSYRDCFARPPTIEIGKEGKAIIF